jgi:predicted nuclease of predicted toxin-antitoxin system
MAKLYADEQFPLPVVEFLREQGHDVLTVQESGCASIPDSQVLAFATAHERAVLTQNRRDFIQLHRLQPNHAGIIACTEDRNFEQLATRIHAAIASTDTLKGTLLRVVRPANCRITLI